MAGALYDIEVKDIKGNGIKLDKYKGNVLLIVNTASKCGFTPQYQGLEGLYKKYKDQGLVVLGFPCDQFGHQEPGNEGEIETFCTRNFGVTFPLFAKIDVNGDHTHPLYVLLKKTQKGFLGTEGIKWNFTKFLVNQEGAIIDRYSPTTTPESIENDIVKVIAKGLLSPRKEGEAKASE